MRLSFTGDILVEKEQLKVIGKGDYLPIIAPAKSAFIKSDYIIGNLETPIADKKLGFTKHMWSFNTPVQLLDALKVFGFNLLITANNHCLDRGIEGMMQTINNLQKYGINYVGTRASCQDKNSYEIDASFGRIAILAYTYGTNATFNNNYLSAEERRLVNLYKPQEPRPKKINRFNILLRAINKFNGFYRSRFQNYLPDIKREIRKVKESGAKIVIMCLHIGEQYMPQPSEETYRITKWMLKNGVDIVVGNHEHVIHPIVKCGEKIVAYSLGNFTATPASESALQNRNSTINKTDYSAILHLDIDEYTMQTVVSFQIAKTITGDDGISRTFILYDLISGEKNPHERRKLIEDNEWLVRKILQKPDIDVVLHKEYRIE